MTNRYYPVNLDIRDRSCLVVGGGGVGTRKVQGLLDCSARVTLISPEATETLKTIAADGRIIWHRRRFAPGDVTGHFLVIGATNDEPLNRQVHADANAHGLLCNIADRPEICNFILPAVIRRGDLSLAISTAGRSPAFAKHLRKTLAVQFGPEYETFLDLMGAVRKRLLAEDHAPEAHKPLFEALISSGLLDMIRDGDTTGVDALLLDILGDGYNYRSLMNSDG
ncbi:MAG: bifunctional precorrin-2 dehydrogenase/sirohydrochlorin ferrochelatase [Pseudomonadota bacterium]